MTPDTPQVPRGAASIMDRVRAALRSHPGSGLAALARAAGESRKTVASRLYYLHAHGHVSRKPVGPVGYNGRRTFCYTLTDAPKPRPGPKGPRKALTKKGRRHRSR